MNTPRDRVLNVRIPADLRRQLDAAASGSPRGMSIVARNALAAGLAVIANDPNRDPPPAGPAAATPMRVAA